jgi:hypothetical protein
MPVDREALRDAWIALLGRWEWEWFCTFTFRDLVHPEAADKRFRVLISQANRVLWGVRWYQRRQGLRWVRALEYQKRDVIHYHALLAGVQDSDPCTCNGAITSVRRRTSEREWRVVFHMNGFFGFHRISGEPNKRTDTVGQPPSKF